LALQSAKPPRGGRYTGRRTHDELMAALQDRLSKDDLKALMTEGTLLSADRAIQEALTDEPAAVAGPTS